MSDSIKVGDLVRTRQGGPLMVVKSITTTPNGTVMVGCVPFDRAEADATVVERTRLVSVN